MVTLLLKASLKEQCSVIRFLWAKGLTQMPFTLRYIQYMVTSVLQGEQYMFGVRSLLMTKKVLLMKKDLVDVLF